MAKLLLNANGKVLMKDDKVYKAPVSCGELEEFDSKIYYRQTRPKDWLKVNLPSEMEELYPDQDRIEILFEIQEDDENILTFKISGIGTIDWGDGTTETFNGNYISFQKVYSNDIGVKQVLVVITAEKNKLALLDFRIAKKFTNEDGYTASVPNNPSTTYIKEISINAKEFELKTIGGSSSQFNGYMREVEYISLNCKLEDTKSFFSNMENLKVFPEFTMTNKGQYFNLWFNRNYNLRILPSIDFSQATNINNLCEECLSLVTVPDIYAPLITSIQNIFYQCKKLKNIGKLTFGELTNAYRAFMYCESMKELPLKNTETLLSIDGTISFCHNIEKLVIDCSSATSLVNINYCYKLKEMILTNTHNLTNINGLGSNCFHLKKCEEIDMKNLTTSSSISNLFAVARLEYLKLKNIKINLSLSSQPLLTKNSLIGLIKELIDTGATLKLTLGSNNLNKLTDIYVKLTNEPEEDETNPKLPCEVCEPTDDGAMLITAYANSKNWTLA